jgi:hypothetical protein
VNLHRVRGVTLHRVTSSRGGFGGLAPEHKPTSKERRIPLKRRLTGRSFFFKTVGAESPHTPGWP